MFCAAENNQKKWKYDLRTVIARFRQDFALYLCPTCWEDELFLESPEWVLSRAPRTFKQIAMPCCSLKFYFKKKKVMLFVMTIYSSFELNKLEYHSCFKSFFCYCFFLFPKIHLFYNYFPENYSICPPA